MVFVPKGEEPDERVVTREPADTRPLSPKNSDNKLAGTVLNRKFRQPLSVHACSLQRGFVPVRRLVANVVDLDTYARVHGMQSDVSDPSVLSLRIRFCSSLSLDGAQLDPCMSPRLRGPCRSCRLHREHLPLQHRPRSCGGGLHPTVFHLLGCTARMSLVGVLVRDGNRPILDMGVHSAGTPRSGHDQGLCG